MLKIINTTTAEQIASAKELFLEYAHWLDFPLCFQGFEEELAGLPGKYTPPEGRLYLAYWNDELAGCIALRKFDDGICEMKRLYVRPDFRKLSIGRKLIQKIIDDAIQIGYITMRLDTIEGRMDEAIALYKKIGFVKIEKYYENPDPHTLYMELKLNP